MSGKLTHTTDCITRFDVKLMADILPCIIDGILGLESQTERCTDDEVDRQALEASALKTVRDFDVFAEQIEPYLKTLHGWLSTNSDGGRAAGEDPVNLFTDDVKQLIFEAADAAESLKSAVIKSLKCDEYHRSECWNVDVFTLQPAASNVAVSGQDGGVSTFAKRIAMDIGGTLLKLAYVSKAPHCTALYNIYWLYNAMYDSIRCMEDLYKVDVLRRCNMGSALRNAVPKMIRLENNNVLLLSQFPVESLDCVIDFLIANNLVGKDTVIYATGGGSYKYDTKIQERLPQCKYQRQEEGQCFVDGTKHMHQVSNSVIKYNVERLFTQIVTLERTYPYFIVNIGSGISIVKVISEDSFERVTGTSIGGGTVYGLANSIMDLDSFDDLMAQCDIGTNCVDSFEHGHLSDNPHPWGLKASFGAYQGDARHEDSARSIADMVSYNIGQIAYLVAKLHGVKRLFFTGFYTSNYRVTMDATAAAIDFMAKSNKEEPMEVLVPLFGSYAGVLGCFLSQ